MKIKFFKLMAGLFFLLFIACNTGKSYYLETEKINQNQGTLFIEGRVNLPDKAQLLISLLAQNDKVLEQSLPLVKGQKFSAELKVGAYPQGSYILRIRFSPDSFDWSGGKVIEEVGSRGENLKGKYVRFDERGFKYLEMNQKIELE